MNKILIIGTNALAAEIVNFIERYQLAEVVGFIINKTYIKDNQYLDRPIYPIEKLEEFYRPDEIKLFCAVSWYNYLNRFRKEKFNELKSKGYSFTNLISPNAILDTEDIGEGNWINDFAHIGFHSKLGDNNIIQPKVTVNHYSVIGNHNSMIADTSIGGHVICGDCSFFGINSTVFNRIVIGNKCVIGGWAVVKNDLPDFSLCVAQQASYIKQYSEKKIEEYISPMHVSRTIEEFDITRNLLNI